MKRRQSQSSAFPISAEVLEVRALLSSAAPMMLGGLISQHESASQTGTVAATGFTETPLVSNVPGLAPNTDRELINPWGFFETSSGQFRVAANGSGQGILFNAQGQKSGADINIPPPAGSPSGSTSTPNGVIDNTTSDFVITFKG